MVFAREVPHFRVHERLDEIYGIEKYIRYGTLI